MAVGAVTQVDVLHMADPLVDYAIRVGGLHTVDVGPVDLGGSIDFTTRDGLPASIRWTPELGFLIAVQTDVKDADGPWSTG